MNRTFLVVAVVLLDGETKKLLVWMEGEEEEKKLLVWMEEEEEEEKKNLVLCL